MAPTTIRLSDVEPKPRWMTSWERLKHKEAHWLVEMVAEMLGVALYVYAGVGATCAFVVGSLIEQNGIGSLFTVGIAYATGVVFAISLCAATSGGHFNPAVTITFVVFRGFPLAKAFRYIFAQCLGAYLVCLIVYVQWKDLLLVAEEVLVKNGLYDTVMFSNGGPAGAFGLYVAADAYLPRVLLNEFVTDFVIGLVIWGCLDPTNHMIPPSSAPMLIGLAYAMAVWSYSPPGIAANTARDVGGRLAAMTIWGFKASGGRYAAIAALGNIPATLFAALVSELFLGSSTRTLTPNHVHFLRAHKQYCEDNDLAPYGYLEGLDKQRHRSSGTLQSGMDEKRMSQPEIFEVSERRV
ncbi:aquaporin-like protein [Rhizopogon salebrosus TDB-379]|nr:aquaporin-like protein [Rhizopogon salebrosus TDB-379]